mgnify:CR=1 FL=1
MAEIPVDPLQIISGFGPHVSSMTGARLSTSLEPDRTVKTHCCFCGQQCGIQLKVRDNQVIGFEPWEEFPFNRGMLCPKGVKRYLQGSHPDRLTTDCNQHDRPERQLIMHKDRPDKFPAERRDHVETVAAGRGKPPQIDCKNPQQDDRHAKGGEVTKEDAGRQQRFVKTFPQVSRQSTQRIPKDPANNNGWKLQHNRPSNRGPDHVCNRSWILADRVAEIATSHVPDVDRILLKYRLICAEQLGILLVHRLHACGIRHALRHPCGNRSHRISRHQARQEEVDRCRGDLIKRLAWLPRRWHDERRVVCRGLGWRRHA